MIGTLVFYLFVLCLVLVLCKPKHGHINKKSVYWALAILLMVTVFRWDIGNDYANYAKRVAEIATTKVENNQLVPAAGVQLQELARTISKTGKSERKEVSGNSFEKSRIKTILF